MNEYNWYTELIKPTWAPPSWVFGPAWTFLYTIIFITFGYVFYKAYKREIPRIVALPFALNLFFNLIFSPIQFGLQNNLLASIDILLILGTIIWFMISTPKKVPALRFVSYANIPYLLWVTFATCLQLTITYLNW
ncbi:MAG: tryptophan-rich sensory protein [Candidatus Taylorbacteria bacterium]|nr:tryptophan-rich sensory protein [Candidatus Taylorbacteria bacterium]